MKDSLIDMAPVPMFVYQEKVVYANQAAVKLVGYALEEIIGMCVCESIT